MVSCIDLVLKKSVIRRFVSAPLPQGAARFFVLLHIHVRLVDSALADSGIVWLKVDSTWVAAASRSSPISTLPLGLETAPMIPLCSPPTFLLCSQIPGLLPSKRQ